jgi:hypothetical protein
VLPVGKLPCDEIYKSAKYPTCGQLSNKVLNKCSILDFGNFKVGLSKDCTDDQPPLAIKSQIGKHQTYV